MLDDDRRYFEPDFETHIYSRCSAEDQHVYMQLDKRQAMLFYLMIGAQTVNDAERNAPLDAEMELAHAYLSQGYEAISQQLQERLDEQERVCSLHSVRTLLPHLIVDGVHDEIKHYAIVAMSKESYAIYRKLPIEDRDLLLEHVANNLEIISLSGHERLDVLTADIINDYLQNAEFLDTMHQRIVPDRTYDANRPSMPAPGEEKPHRRTRRGNFFLAGAMGLSALSLSACGDRPETSPSSVTTADTAEEDLPLVTPAAMARIYKKSLDSTHYLTANEQEILSGIKHDSELFAQVRALAQAADASPTITPQDSIEELGTDAPFHPSDAESSTLKRDSSAFQKKTGPWANAINLGESTKDTVKRR